MLKAFAINVQTGDGFRALLGGLCPSARRKELERQLLQIRNLTFGNYRDPYEIDFRFVQLLHQLQNDPIPYVLAGCISVPSALDHCGAVLGIPDGTYTSADIRENPILLMSDPPVYSACFSGKMGAAFVSTYTDACLLTYGLEEKLSKPFTKVVLEEAVDLIRQRTDLYVICSDIQPASNGKVSGGALIVADEDGERKLFLNTLF